MISPYGPEFEDYLHDESRLVGSAESISFPRSEDEVAAVLRELAGAGSAVTIQGGRTGIVGGAVPSGGHILNLSRMNEIGPVEPDSVTVEPGALLSDVRAAVEPYGLYFPPDPTETSASIGGMVACNASGAASFHYGPTRNWVNAIRLVLVDGDTLVIARGQYAAVGRTFSIATEGGRVISGQLPGLSVPHVKSAAGYYCADDMDLFDLFIGSEGTLGVITQVELRVIPQPAAVAGLMLFLPSEGAALRFVRWVRGQEAHAQRGVGAGSGDPRTAGETHAQNEPAEVKPVAIEFFSSHTLDLLRSARASSSAFAEIPALKQHYHTAVYVEFHGETEDDLEAAALQASEAAIALGSGEDDTWFATTPRELEPIKAFRHAAPEAVNLLIGERKRSCPGLTKLGTDMSVPDAALEEAMAMYAGDLEREDLEWVAFGHIGNNHVHVNILPRDMGEYDAGKRLYMAWARRVVEMGGSVSAEHGIGKLKAPFLRMMYGREGVAEMLALKKLFDPELRLNPGDLFGQIDNERGLEE